MTSSFFIGSDKSIVKTLLSIQILLMPATFFADISISYDGKLVIIIELIIVGTWLTSEMKAPAKTFVITKLYYPRNCILLLKFASRWARRDPEHIEPPPGRAPGTQI